LDRAACPFRGALASSCSAVISCLAPCRSPSCSRPCRLPTLGSPHSSLCPPPPHVPAGSMPHTRRQPQGLSSRRPDGVARQRVANDSICTCQIRHLCSSPSLLLPLSPLLLPPPDHRRSPPRRAIMAGAAAQCVGGCRLRIAPAANWPVLAFVRGQAVRRGTVCKVGLWTGRCRALLPDAHALGEQAIRSVFHQIGRSVPFHLPSRSLRLLTALQGALPSPSIATCPLQGRRPRAGRCWGG